MEKSKGSFAGSRVGEEHLGALPVTRSWRRSRDGVSLGLEIKCGNAEDGEVDLVVRKNKGRI